MYVLDISFLYVLNINRLCKRYSIKMLKIKIKEMINNKKKNVGIDNFDKLCAYFSCELSDLVEYIKD